MVSIAYRPMTAAERVQLKHARRAMGGVPVALGLMLLIGLPLMGTVIGWVQFIVVPGSAFDFYNPWSSWSSTVGAIAGAALAVFAFWRIYRERRQSKRPYDQDLSENTVEVLRCEAQDAVMVEEVEGGDPTCSGPAFFLDLGGSRILFLYVEELRDLVSVKKFPNRVFEVIRAPNTGLMFGVEVQGEPFMSSRVLELLKIKEYGLRGCDMLTGDLGSLEDVLRERAASRGGHPAI